MEKEKALNRTRELLKDFENIIGNKSEDVLFYDIKELRDEFVNLVYAYDNNLPFNDEVKKMPSWIPLYGKEIEQVRYYIKFFIKYLEHYA